MRDHDDMPQDPDWADVPEGWKELDGKQVTVTDPDGEMGDEDANVLVIVPGLFGHRRRLAEGFFTDQEDDDAAA